MRPSHRTPIVRTLAATAATVALLATAACGGSSDDKKSSGSGSSSSSASASSSSSASASASASSSPTKLPTYSTSTAKAGRPSVAKISASLVKGSKSSGQGYTAAQATCVAKALRQSKVSNVALNAIVKLDPQFTASAADNTALQAVATQLSTCSSAE